MDQVDSSHTISDAGREVPPQDDPNLSPDSANIKAEIAENLIIEQNITDLSEDDHHTVTSDLCDALQPAEPLSIIVGDEVGSLTSEDAGVWTSASQDLALSGCYIYQCSDNTYRVTTCTDSTTTTKSSNEVYTCEIPGCERQFSTPGYLKIHQLVHSGNRSKLTCPYQGCGRTFSWPAHLKYHQMTHSGKRAYTCSYLGCGKSFYTSQRLVVHTRLHTGERPYVCQVEGCNKSFTTAGNLKNHARIHSGEKPFACDVEGCNKRFAEYSSLHKHKVIHSGEKPFQCELCGQPFTQSGSRNVHMRRHHSKPATVIPGSTSVSNNITKSPVVPSTIITSSDVTQFVTIATDSIIGVTTECASKAGDQVDDNSEDVHEVIKQSANYGKSTLIIMTGAQEFQYSDEVVSVSTQPLHISYQDALSHTESMLATQGDEDFQKVIVRKEVTNPEVTLSSFC